jgi:hypothetical protein
MHAFLEQAFDGRENETKPVEYKNAVAGLTFIPSSEIRSEQPVRGATLARCSRMIPHDE